MHSKELAKYCLGHCFSVGCIFLLFLKILPYTCSSWSWISMLLIFCSCVRGVFSIAIPTMEEGLETQIYTQFVRLSARNKFFLLNQDGTSAQKIHIDSGWHQGIRQIDTEKTNQPFCINEDILDATNFTSPEELIEKETIVMEKKRGRMQVSCREYYCYKLQIRRNWKNVFVSLFTCSCKGQRPYCFSYRIFWSGSSITSWRWNGLLKIQNPASAQGATTEETLKDCQDTNSEKAVILTNKVGRFKNHLEE